jgi:hypothetical protein
VAAVPFAAHADVKGTHVNQFVFCSRRQGRVSVRSFLSAMLLFSVTLFSNGAYASGTLTISGTPASTAAVGSAYSFTPTVKDSLTGRTLAFNIVQKPSWATFSGTTGKLSGTPTAANVGKYANIGIAVNDGINAAVLTSFSITVQAATGGTTPTSGITISGTPASTVAVGSAYSFTPTVKDSLTGRTLAFNIVQKPSWATFSSTTGKLSGTPTSANVGKYSNIGIAVNDGINAAVLSSFSITVQSSSGTTSTVKISGTPATSVVAGSAYKFQPTATDSAGRTISFSVQNKPAWATFSIATGLLSGTPSTSQTGTYGNIIVSASDGQSSSSLAPFSVAVTSSTPPASTGSATLYWTDPTQNTNGTPLTNFAGIRIYYGTSSASLNHVVQIPGATATNYTVANLAAGTWYFGATAYNTVGAESGLSKVGSKTIQ